MYVYDLIEVECVDQKTVQCYVRSEGISVKGCTDSPSRAFRYAHLHEATIEQFEINHCCISHAANLRSNVRRIIAECVRIFDKIFAEQRLYMFVSTDVYYAA